MRVGYAPLECAQGWGEEAAGSRQHPGGAEELSCDGDPVQGTLTGRVSVRKGEVGAGRKAAYLPLHLPSDRTGQISCAVQCNI